MFSIKEKIEKYVAYFNESHHTNFQVTPNIIHQGSDFIDEVLHDVKVSNGKYQFTVQTRDTVGLTTHEDFPQIPFEMFELIVNIKRMIDEDGLNKER